MLTRRRLFLLVGLTATSVVAVAVVLGMGRPTATQTVHTGKIVGTGTLTAQAITTKLGKASVSIKDFVVWPIPAPAVLVLDHVDTTWGTLYVGRLDGTVDTKKGTEPISMRHDLQAGNGSVEGQRRR